MENMECKENCRYETDSFTLRQVEEADAPALLKCYGDPAAVALMNDDNCARGFFCQTEEDVRSYISFWNRETKIYARLAITDKRTREVVGTVEIFGGESGVLRVDLRADFELDGMLEELYRLAMGAFVQDFPMGALITKAPPAALARRRVLEKLGFSGPDDFRGYPDYYKTPARPFRRELGIAACGLACCLCSESDTCPGCQKEGCPGHGTCYQYACVKERGIHGCWQCPSLSCGRGMHESLRIRAFAQFARERGTEQLLDCLERNQRAGVLYHYPGSLRGDYDLPAVEAVFRLIETGRWK